MPEDVQFGVQFVPDIDDLQDDIDDAKLEAEVDAEATGMDGGMGVDAGGGGGGRGDMVKGFLAGLLAQAESIQSILDLIFGAINMAMLPVLKRYGPMLAMLVKEVPPLLRSIVDGINNVIAGIETMINEIGKALARFANKIPGVSGVRFGEVSLGRVSNRRMFGDVAARNEGSGPPTVRAGNPAVNRGGTGSQPDVNITVRDDGLSPGAERQKKANTIGETLMDEATGYVGDLFNG